MSYFTGSRGRIHHDAWLPEGEVRSAVLMIHGYAEHLGLYAPLAARLNADGHAVHSFDQVGHGRSDGERALIESWDIIVEDARQLAAHIAVQHPGVPVTVIGHSGGSLAAFLLTTRYPELASAAVLSAGPLLPVEWGGGELDEMLSTHPDYVHALIHDPLIYNGGFLPETLDAVERTWPEVEAALAQGRPDLPVLLVHGEEDPVVPVDVSRAVATRLPRAELRTFPGDLHDVLNEHNRDEVHDVVATWLARVLAEQRSRAAVGS
jgi:alpha-beta hydrolase superfamily lysophospholipase